MQLTLKTASLLGKRLPAMLGLATLAAALPHPARAQDYTLGSGDNLSVSAAGTAGTASVNGGPDGPVSSPSPTASTIELFSSGATLTIAPGGTVDATSAGGGNAVYNGGTVTVTGGTVTTSSFEGIDNQGTLDMSAGTVSGGDGYYGIFNSATFNFSGGTAEDTGGAGIGNDPNGTINWTGGQAREDLANSQRGDLTNNGTVNFFGTGFAIDGTPYGPGSAYTGDTGFGTATLTGTLADGEALDLTFSNNGTFNFIHATPAPEPSSVAAFAFTGLFAAGLILRAMKRRAVA